MAGYSGTPLAKKLGIKPGHRVHLRDSPEGFEKTLDDLPDDVTIERGGRGRQPIDVAVFFVKERRKLIGGIEALRTRLAQNGGLWIAWPKRASGVATDLDETKIRADVLATGLVDNKVCAIDETWSGLRFVIRLVDRK